MDMDLGIGEPPGRGSAGRWTQEHRGRRYLERLVCPGGDHVTFGGQAGRMDVGVGKL